MERAPAPCTQVLGDDGQEPGKVPRVGFLGPRSRSDRAPLRDAFMQDCSQDGGTRSDLAGEGGSHIE
jgi:hypothetical protein